MVITDLTEALTISLGFFRLEVDDESNEEYQL